jgi:hypothetical protein
VSDRIGYAVAAPPLNAIDLAPQLIATVGGVAGLATPPAVTEGT